ncbi:MAG TPA: Hsp70 family protein, partial [Thermoanaerobaculia bacterium]|nr:Hsp70 family protein [Thermoanaerobaculia bacterium]
MSDGPSCAVCGWEIRDSDVHCCFCGTLQRQLDLVPPAMVLAPPEDGFPGTEAVSPGQIELRNAGRQSLHVLCFEPPAGVEVSAEPPFEGTVNKGLLLRVGGMLRLQGRRAGEIGEERPVLIIRTSIGALRLPIHTRPLPRLELDRREFLLAKGQVTKLVLSLSLSEGVEWTELEAQGAGLTLLEPTDPVRLEAGSPLRIVLQADAAECLRGEEPRQIVVHLADRVPLPPLRLSFKEAKPARLFPRDGIDHLEFRVFPQELSGEPIDPWRRESLFHEIEIRNAGMLDYSLKGAELTWQRGRSEDDIRLVLLDSLGRPLEVPHKVAPDESFWLRIECPFCKPPGSLRDGTLVVSGEEGFEPLRLAFRLDSREPQEYLMPVGLDFGTSASAVATRTKEQDAPGRVLSISFRPRYDEKSASRFLPSDVQIVCASKGEDPAFEIDWGDFGGSRHLTFARNLKRRLGLPSGHSESVEPVFFQGTRTDLPVEDLAAFVVYEMKRQAERHLGARLTHGIATVPTRFSLRRVQAIRQVYQRAGFRDVSLIDESVAAGILGMYNQFRERERYTFLVYDMGGGTTDVTLFEVENVRSSGILEIRPKILGVTGDARLGGRDVTDLMVQSALASLSPEERGSIPWIDRRFDSPELQAIAKRNQNDLFLAVEDAKLRLFRDNQSELVLTPTLYDERNSPVICSSTAFRRSEVEAALRPRLERLWREIRDLLDVAGVRDLDILYLVGRSAVLPIIREGLVEWLTADGRSPRLERVFPADREGKPVLKEAVSLGACLAQDLLYGIDERLVTEDLEQRFASRFGIRDQRGDFREILP